MEEKHRSDMDQNFQQFQAVAVVEAIARFSELQGRWGEMTFKLRADGRVLAEGCIMKAISTRQWCRGLLP